ncbi:MAG: hypothetical protein V4707_09360 [Pseudomonadota bacterium]
MRHPGLIFLAALSACAPAVGDGPPFPIAADLAASARVGRVTMQSDMFNVPDDFSRLFATEVAGSLVECARGQRTLNLKVFIHELDRNGDLLESDGRTRLPAVAELSTPDGRVVGRYDLRIDLPGAETLEARRVAVSRAIGIQLCRTAFAPES